MNRKRAPNFTEEKKMRFLKLIQAKGRAIVSKVTSHDLQTNKLKEESWVEITRDLNVSGTIMRTTENLKKLWQKMKTEAKVLKSQSFNQFHGTGGGPSKKIDDPVLELVVQITGRGSTGIDCVEDSDFITEEVLAILPTSPELSSQDVACESFDSQRPIIKPTESGAHLEVQETIEILNENGVVSDTPKRCYKRNRPTIEPGSNERAGHKPAKIRFTNALADDKLKAEKEKNSLIALQREHMIELHRTQLENEKKQSDLKINILQEILNKIKDEKPVDREILKAVLNIDNKN